MAYRIVLLLFALLDGVLFVRYGYKGLINAWYEIIGPNGPLIWKVTLVVKSLFYLSLPVSAIGLSMAKKWSCILTYIQFPFHVLFAAFSFGFIYSLGRFFPERGMTGIYFFFWTCVSLELARVSVTVIAHIRLKKWGKLSPPSAQDFRSVCRLQNRIVAGICAFTVAVIFVIGLILFSGRIYLTIIDALKAGDYHVVRSRVEEYPAAVTATYGGGQTLLHILAKSPWLGERERMAQYLIEKGADVNAKTAFGRPVILHCAGDISLTTVLLDHGADINSRASDGITLLHEAACMNDPNYVKLVLSRGADVLARITDTGQTALHVAAEAAQPLNVEMLLERGAELNAKDKNGSTALHLAAVERRLWPETYHYHMKLELRSRLETVKLLIEAGLKPDAKDNNGETPLQRAMNFSDEYPQYLADLEKLLTVHSSQIGE